MKNAKAVVNYVKMFVDFLFSQSIDELAEMSAKAEAEDILESFGEVGKALEGLLISIIGLIQVSGAKAIKAVFKAR